MSTSSTLPDHAPSRCVRPSDTPSPAAARALLAREGVDATDLDALIDYVSQRGWMWRMGRAPSNTGRRGWRWRLRRDRNDRDRRYWAAVIVPWVSRDPWAAAWGSGPDEALSIAMALTIQTPPPELVDEGRGVIEEDTPT